MFVLVLIKFVPILFVLVIATSIPYLAASESATAVRVRALLRIP